MNKNKISYGELNNLNLKVLIALTRTSQGVHKRSADIFMEGGLTTSQFSALEALYHKGSMSVKELVQSALSTSGNMTVVIKNLEKEELLSRRSNPEDGRSSLLSITDKGKKKIEEIFPQHLIDLKKCFENLSKEEKELLITTMKKIGTPLYLVPFI